MRNIYLKVFFTLNLYNTIDQINGLSIEKQHVTKSNWKWPKFDTPSSTNRDKWPAWNQGAKEPEHIEVNRFQLINWLADVTWICAR